jgi:citrate synthase
MLDALMIILVEHGMVSHVIAARLIYHCAPEAMQAAVAAALCGAGSVHLGSSEWSAKMLQDALPQSTQNPEYDAIATKIIDDYTARKQRMPGIGHRTHAEGDPRAETLFNIARETGVYGKYCELIQRLSQLSSERRKRLIPVNVTGAIAAISAAPWAPSAISPKRSKIPWLLRSISRSSKRWYTSPCGAKNGLGFRFSGLASGVSASARAT